MPTPTVTITGTLHDLTGTVNIGSIEVELENYGANVPRITGTSILAQILRTVVANGSGVFSVTVWGNHQISPTGTFYTIRFLSDTGAVIADIPYQFMQDGSFDLSSQTPLVNIPNTPVTQVSFGALTSGANSTATMTVATGASLVPSGSGVINATEINGVPITGTPSLGKIPIGQGDGTAVFADPLVQGLQAAGTSASTVNPVLVGFKGVDGNIHTASSDNTGALNITGSITASNPSVSTTGTAIPASGTLVAGSDGTNLKAVKVSTAGVVSVDGSAVTQPVSGTVAVSNSFALDATLTGGTQKTKIVDTGGTNVATVSAAGAVKVDGSAVTQPISGSVTANIGTSGSLALDASVTGLQVAQASTTSGQKGGLALGAVTTAAPSYTTAQSDPLSLDTSGLLRVSLKDTPANTNKFLVTADPITFASAQHIITDSGTISTITNAVTVVGAAASGATKSGNPVQIGGVFNTTQPTVTTGQAVEAQATARGAQIVATGVDAFAVNATLSAETTKVIGTVNIASGQTVGIVAGTAVIGHVIVDTAPSTAVTNAGTFAVQQTPKTSGGMGLPFSASVNATKQQVKATAGNVYGWNIVNNTAAIAYCQVFNLASASVTVGTTTPDYVIAIPGNSTTGAGNTVALDLGISHGTGITIACTTTRTGLTGAACDVLFFFN